MRLAASLKHEHTTPCGKDVTAMLFASSHAAFGQLAMATHFAVDRDVRIYASDRKCMRSDSQFIPATPIPARDVSVLWFLLDGTVQVTRGDETFSLTAPAALRMPEHWLEGASGHRTVRICTDGDRYASVQVLYRAKAEGHEVLHLSDETFAFVSRYHASVFAEGTDAEQLSAVKQLLRALTLRGVLPEAFAPEHAIHADDPSLARVWAAMRERYAAFDTNPSLKMMAVECGLSLRHTARLIAESFQVLLMPPGGFRETTMVIRLSLASLLLSGSSLSVGEIATLVGYGHPESLTNAFKRANLPPPTQVKQGYAGGARISSKPPIEASFEIVKGRSTPLRSPQFG